MDDYLEEKEYVDVEGTIEAIHEAWKCVPDLTLSELLDTATSMPFCELTTEEFISELNDFILQNHQA